MTSSGRGRVLGARAGAGRPVRKHMVIIQVRDYGDPGRGGSRGDGDNIWL